MKLSIAKGLKLKQKMTKIPNIQFSNFYAFCQASDGLRGNLERRKRHERKTFVVRDFLKKTKAVFSLKTLQYETEIHQNLKVSNF